MALFPMADGRWVRTVDVMCRRSSLRDALSWMESLSPTIETRIDLLDAQAVKLACELRAAGDLADLLGQIDVLRHHIAQADGESYPGLVAAVDQLAAAIDANRRRPLVSESSPPRSHVRAKTRPDLDELAKRYSKP